MGAGAGEGKIKVTFPKKPDPQAVHPGDRLLRRQGAAGEADRGEVSTNFMVAVETRTSWLAVASAWQRKASPSSRAFLLLGRPSWPPNKALQQTAAAMLVCREFMFLSAAAAAELCRSS